MSMLLSALVADLKASLSDAAAQFRAADDGDFKRLLGVALAGSLTPRVSLAPQTLLLEIGSCLRLFGGLARQDPVQDLDRGGYAGARRHRRSGVALQQVAGDLGEQPLDLVDPGRVGRGEMQAEPGNPP